MFFQKMNKINKVSARIRKKSDNSNKIRHEKRGIINDSTEKQRIIRNYYT